MISKRSGWRALVIALMLVVSCAVASATLGAQQRPRTADEEFVPIDQLPADDKLPAAPFLIAAYSVAWLAVAAYLYSLWQRLHRVERELAEVDRRLGQHGGR